jgi:hypothetical protein
MNRDRPTRLEELVVTPEMVEAGLDAFLPYVLEEEINRATTGLGPGLKAAFSAMLQKAR